MRKGLKVMKPIKTKEYSCPSIKNGQYWVLGKDGKFLWEDYGKDFEQFIKDLTEDLRGLKKLSLADVERERFGCNQNCDVTIIDYILEKLGYEDKKGNSI